MVSLLADLSELLTWEWLAGDSYMRGFHGAAGGLQEPKSLPQCLLIRPVICLLSPIGLWMQVDWTLLELLTGIPLIFSLMNLGLRIMNQHPCKGLTRLPIMTFLALWQRVLCRSFEFCEALGCLWPSFFNKSPASPSWRRHVDIRFFNCFKNANADRMIGDRRIRNWKEGRLPGALAWPFPFSSDCCQPWCLGGHARPTAGFCLRVWSQRFLPPVQRLPSTCCHKCTLALFARARCPSAESIQKACRG